MNIADICITFTVSILSIAYPLLITVISRLDDKYSSILILELFRKEKVWVTFRILLLTTLALILIYIILNTPFGISVPSLFRYIHIALLVASLSALITFLFLFGRLVFVYFALPRVLQYFIGKKDNDEHLYFRAIADMLYFAIRQQDEITSKTISDYMYRAFLSVRENNVKGAVLYPVAYYETVSKIVLQLAQIDNKRFAFLDFRVAGGIWLLGELQDVEIHEATYANLWRNLVTTIEYERDDLVMHYWGRAHQHFVYQLAPVYAKHSSIDNGLQVLNQGAIDKRKQERKRFLQFNYALGGLLVYAKRYKAINRIFNYTTSQPPSYDLLPLSMQQIFYDYFSFIDPYHETSPANTERYYFPETEGIGAEGIVSSYTAKYFALLFIRQWTIIPYLVTIRPFDFPQLPATQSEKLMWLDSLPYFKNQVEWVLGQKELLADTRLDMINDEWCEKNDKPKPTKFIDDLIDSLKQSFERTEEIQPVSKEKVQQFYESSQKILKSAIEPYANIFKGTISKEYDNWIIGGIRTPIEKSPFAENQGVSNMNFDSFIASMQAEKIQHAISETFFYKTTQQYLLKGAELFAAIDKTKIKAETHIIVNFGIAIDHYVNFEKVQGLSINAYKGIEIISFSSYNMAVVSDTLFLMKKQDLPTLVFGDVEKKDIDKYALQLLDDRYKIWGTVIDLNTAQQIKEEINNENPGHDLKKSVLLYLAMQLEIRWKKQIKVVALIEYSEYRNNGLPNSLKDVKRF